MQKCFFFFFVLWCFASVSLTYAEPIKIGVTESVTVFHPLLEEVTSGDTYVRKFLHKPFLHFDKNEKITCGLCKILPTLENMQLEQTKEGPQLASFEIRDDAQWNDGKPITTEDVEFSWKLAMAYLSEKSDDTSLLPYIQAIKKDKKNPKKFQLQFLKSHLDQILNQFFLVPSHLERSIWNQYENDFASYLKNS